MKFSAVVAALVAGASATALSARAPLPFDAYQNPSCTQLYKTCIAENDTSKLNAYTHRSCVVSAACFDTGSNSYVDSFVAYAYYKAFPEPKGIQTRIARLKAGVIGAGNHVTQQQFIDAYYGELSKTNGPWPANVDVVKKIWRKVSGWSGHQEAEGVPIANLADYFQYSGINAPPDKREEIEN